MTTKYPNAPCRAATTPMDECSLCSNRTGKDFTNEDSFTLKFESFTDPTQIMCPILEEHIDTEESGNIVEVTGVMHLDESKSTQENDVLIFLPSKFPFLSLFLLSSLVSRSLLASSFSFSVPVCCIRAGDPRSVLPASLFRAPIDGLGSSPTNTVDHTRCVVRALMPASAALPPHVCHRQETGQSPQARTCRSPSFDTVHVRKLPSKQNGYNYP